MPKRAKSWTPEQRQFMLWLATPDVEKTILTQGAYARETGRADSTLSDWKRLPGFQEAVNDIVRAGLGDAYPEVVQALKREAGRGNYPHMKLFFELTGEYVQKQAIDVSGSIALTEVEVCDRWQIKARSSHDGAHTSAANRVWERQCSRYRV